MSKETQNAIYNVAGDASSGLLLVTDLASAQVYRNRFTSGTYVLPEPVAPAELAADATDEQKAAHKVAVEAYAKAREEFSELLHSKKAAKKGIDRPANGVTINDDGSLTVPEVLPSQGNGYDSYGNRNGFLRKDTPYDFPPQSLSKFGIVLFDALHIKAASDDEDERAEALAVLQTLREFDAVAAAEVKTRGEQAQFEKAKAIAVNSGIDGDAFDAFWKQRAQQPVAALTNAPSGNELASEDGDGDETPTTRKHRKAKEAEARA